MAYAAPLPPPPPYPADDGPPTNGSRRPVQNGSTLDNGSRNVEDLVAQASKRIAELGPIPIKSLLQYAGESFREANFRLQQRRRDEAFINYMIAFEIVGARIPSNRGWPDFQRSNAFNDYRQLRSQLKGSQDQFESIKAIIQNENKRSSIRHVGQDETNVLGGPSQSTDTGHGIPRVPINRSGATSPVNGVRSVDQYSSLESFANPRYPQDLSASPRRKPAIRPKPEALNGHAIGPQSNGLSRTSLSPDLASRFAKLRAPDADPNYRPNGPRTMPGNDLNGMAALDTAFASALPRPPDSVYSPARNMQTPEGVSLPRTSARSTIGTGGRVNSIAASSASSRAPGNQQDSDSYFPSASTGNQTTNSNRGSMNGLPTSGRSINAQMLYDSLELYSILVVDVRSRRDFDRGHLNTPDVICIEPQTTLRPNMSAEDLANALILSPDVEHTLFERRNQFHLVVYYDADTATTAFLDQPPYENDSPYLRMLHDALWEFSSEKPLQHRPLLLKGGLFAWTDLLGQGSLETSNTAATKASNAGRPSRRPVPAPLRTSSLNVEKRRRREFNPLDADELKKWEERTRQESAVFEERFEENGIIEEIEEEDEQPDAEAIQVREEFLRRFPSVSEQDSMSSHVRAPSYGHSLAVQPAPPPQANGISAMPSRPAPTAPRVSYRGATERAAATTRSSASSRPYGTSTQSQSMVRLPKTGLINFGVTCYMNASVQCLSATIPLTMLFRDGAYRKYIQRDNWKGSKGLLSENYANLLMALWKGDVGACRPSTFRTFCARLNREWGLDRQQDAKEFLEFVMDYLHEDLNVNWRNPPPHVLTADEESIRERMYKGFAAQIEWTRYSKRDKSVISDLFAGQHASRLRCRTCGFNSTTFETFFSISVEIPRSGPTTVYDCLQSYCREENLSGDEVWKCSRCNVEREASKQITITRAPRNLVLHFKRFRAGHNESARKVSTPIDFPLTGLDISPFVLPPPTRADVEQTVKACDDKAWHTGKLDSCSVGPYIYDAYAVMRHLGSTLSSGHYVSVVRDPGRGCWRLFNDERVNDFDPADPGGVGRIQDERAYIVFYQRRDA